MKFLLLLIASLLLLCCSSENEFSAQNDADSRETTAYSLKNRGFFVTIGNMDATYIDSMQTTYTDTLWKMSVVRTYGKYNTSSFAVDSIVLSTLDSSLNVIEDDAISCTVDSLECIFPEYKNYQTPYVKLIAYGSWRTVRKTSFSVEADSLSAKGKIEYLADIGQDSTVQMNLENILTSWRTSYYVREKNLPYPVARKLAQKDYEKFDYFQKFGVFVHAALVEGNIEKAFANFQDEYGESLNFEKSGTLAADFILDNYRNGSLESFYKNSLFDVYLLDSCNNSYFVDIIKNEQSRFYGSVLVCDSKGWRLYNDSLDSLTPCSIYNDSLSNFQNEESYYTCRNREWGEDYNPTAEQLGLLFGSCTSDSQSASIFEKYYRCEDGTWNQTTLMDYSVQNSGAGSCGSEVARGQMADFHDSVFVCEKRWFASSAQMVGAWTLANDIQAQLFRAHGNCNKNSDTLQMARYDENVFACFDANEKGYTWIALDSAVDNWHTYYIEKTDTSDAEIWGRLSKGSIYFYYLDNADRNFKIYNGNDDHFYSLIYLAFNDLQNSLIWPKIWLDSAMASEGSGNWDESESLCPNGFHVPSLEEWESYLNMVEDGRATEIRYDSTSTESLIYKTSTLATDDEAYAITFIGKEGLSSAKTTTCSKNAKTAIACVKEFYE